MACQPVNRDAKDLQAISLFSPLAWSFFAPCTTVLNHRMGKRVTKKSKLEFAAALKAWRSTHKLSQSQAAERLGVPLKTLQNWEIARTKPQGFAESALLKMIRT